jgi:3-dehydroquinate dehydratase
VISPVVDGTITGLRAGGYRLAIEAAATLLEERA